MRLVLVVARVVRHCCLSQRGTVGYADAAQALSRSERPESVALGISANSCSYACSSELITGVYTTVREVRAGLQVKAEGHAHRRRTDRSDVEAAAHAIGCQAVERNPFHPALPTRTRSLTTRNMRARETHVFRVG